MPIYDYLCGACGHLLEVIHGINAEGPRYCPSCGTEGRMKKAVGAPAVVFKGSGWAKKDRRAIASAAKSSNDSKPAETDKAASGSASGSDSGSSAGSSSDASSSAAGGD